MRTYYLLAILVLTLMASQSFAYTVHINALAVLQGAYTGVATPVYLNVTKGTGIVSVHAGNATVAQDTVQSINYAVDYAASYLGADKNAYNYNFTIVSGGSNISGPSAGLPFALLSIAALKHEQLPGGFVATGTVTQNGTVGEIGGISDKARAAAKAGARFLIVPYAPNDSFEYNLYYVSQQAYGIPLVEVGNVSQAIPYVFGNAAAMPLGFNITVDYNASQLNSTSAICPSCAAQDSNFTTLVNSTFDLLSSAISNINGTAFGSAKNQLMGQMDQYKEIGSRGYLYSASDLAFLDYPEAFLLDNYRAYNVTSAGAVINNIYDYCISATAPQLTTSNYEYVVSAEARYAWAMTDLEAAGEQLNSSQSSDQVFAALVTASRAYAWCSAVQVLYNTSSSMGGTPVAQSDQLQSYASSQIRQAMAKYGNQLYVNESQYSYNIGEYSAALYSLAYANTFYNTSASTNLRAQSNESGIYSMITSSLASANGVWPREFALQSYFYLQQASLAPNASAASADLSAAYSTAQLSFNIDSVDAKISGGLVPVNSTLAAPTPQLSQIEGELNLVYGVVIILIIVVIITLLILIVHIIGHRKEGNQPVRTRRAR